MECAFRKLVMDFHGSLALRARHWRAPLDEEDAEQLVARLCTIAGMLMEDALPTALFTPASAEEITSNLATLSAMPCAAHSGHLIVIQEST